MREVSRLTETYIMFDWYPWEACPFLKRNEEGVDEGGEELGGEEREETSVGI